MVAPADADDADAVAAMGGDAEDGGGGGGGGRPRIPPALPAGDCRWCRMEGRWAPLLLALPPAEPPPPPPHPRAAIVAFCVAVAASVLADRSNLEAKIFKSIDVPLLPFQISPSPLFDHLTLLFE